MEAENLHIQIDTLCDRIRQEEKRMLPLEEYLKFLQFAGRNVTYSIENQLLLHAQAPGASAFAGLMAWKSLLGPKIRPAGDPVFAIYPRYDPEHHVLYPVPVKVFGNTQIPGSEKAVAAQRKNTLPANPVSCLIPWAEDVTGKSIYLSSGINHPDEYSDILLIPSEPGKDSFTFLLRYSLDCLFPLKDDRMLTGSVRRSVQYHVFMALGMEQQASTVSFPYLKQPEMTEEKRKTVLRHTLKASQSILLSLYTRGRLQRSRDTEADRFFEGRQKNTRHFLFDFNETCILNQLLDQDTREGLLEEIGRCIENDTRVSGITLKDDLVSLQRKIREISQDQFLYLKKERSDRKLLTWPPCFI